MTNDIFSNINGFSLDSEQRKAIVHAKKYSLIVAGAGSGKTLTLVGKIAYLIKVKGIHPEDILCISFTNEATKSLQKKLNNPRISIFTFHKLAIKLLALNHVEYDLVEDNFLQEQIHLFFKNICYNNSLSKKLFFKFQRKLWISKRKYETLIQTKSFQTIEKTIETFIKLYQTNAYQKNDFQKLFIKKQSSFLLLIFSIIQIVENTKFQNHLFDFEDLILKATSCINNKENVFPYKEIIIDEFQDTSLLRLQFIKKIVEVNDANLTAVGDDFQAIYKFSGCDLNLFLNFSLYFKGASIHKIQNTYRNSQELIDVAGKFIMQNKKQIQKNLKSNKHLERPIKIIWEEKNKKTSLLQTIEYIQKNYSQNILILGRNNKDIYSYFSNNEIIWKKDGYFNLRNSQYTNLRFLTVHKSKGLECDNVILINLENKAQGFPNQFKEEKIIKSLKKEENFLYAEERRLFYVAITRTKNYNFLLVSKKKASIFVKELLKDKQNLEILKL